MKSCPPIRQLISIILVLLGMTMTQSFTPSLRPAHHQVYHLKATAESVEVCGFKDCKRAGGGPRLEKLVNSILEEKGLVDSIKVEGCECQGECGYGPNLVVDGKIKNYIKTREDVIKALGIQEEEEAADN